MARFKSFLLASSNMIEITINRDHVTAARAKPSDPTTGILLSNGVDYEVRETLGAVQAWLHGAEDEAK